MSRGRIMYGKSLWGIVEDLESPRQVLKRARDETYSQGFFDVADRFEEAIACIDRVEAIFDDTKTLIDELDNDNKSDPVASDYFLALVKKWRGAR